MARNKSKVAPRLNRSAREAPKRARRRQRATLLGEALVVLAEADEPMGARAIVQKVLERGRWSTRGKTPDATLYAAILREIQNKGDRARFRKVGRGRFATA